MSELRTNPVAFQNPHSRANKIGRVLWGIVWLLLFRPTPQCMGAWRSYLLTLFGAKIGRARLHQSVSVWAPWLLELGSDVYIDRNVHLYNVFGLTTGDRVIISLGSFLCGASHDYTKASYPLTGGRIILGSDSWLAADVFVSPGIKIGEGCVVGARSVVTKDVPPWSVIAGNPAKVIKPRTVT